MGCGCGGNRNSVGINAASPLVLGTDDANLPVQRVIVVQATAGVPAGARRFVRGTDVENMLENGTLRPVR